MGYAQQPSASREGAGDWWALLFRGIAAVLFGLAALIWPGLTLFVLIVIYGAFALVDGIFALVAGIRAGSGPRRWMLVGEGVLGVLAGLLVLIWPDISAFVVLYIIAAWAIVGGAFRLVAAISLRREIDNEWSMALSGVLSILFGVVLAVLPGVGLLSGLAHRHLRSWRGSDPHMAGPQAKKPRHQPEHQGSLNSLHWNLIQV